MLLKLEVCLLCAVESVIWSFIMEMRFKNVQNRIESNYSQSPIHDSESEMAEAFKSQSVIGLRRIHSTFEIFSNPSCNVILSFLTPLPDRVKMFNISYPVQLFIPNLFRCVCCWRLGQTKAICKTAFTACKRCGNIRSAEVRFEIWCINCGGSHHVSESVSLPWYVEMKKCSSFNHHQKYSTHQLIWNIPSVLLVILWRYVPHLT